MKTVIYADILVAVNLIVNYLLLRAVSALFKAPHKPWRFLLSSSLGGLFSLIIFVENIPVIINIIIKILFLVIIISVAFKADKPSEFIRYLLSFFLCNFAFAGIMLAINIFFSSEKTIYKNGVIYFDINILTLIMVSVCCYIFLTLLSRIAGNRMVNNLIYDLTLFYDEKSITARALLDTGNTLREGFSGKPVIIADKKTAEALISKDADVTKLKNFRLIPYSTISSGGALPAFLLDKVITYSNGKMIEISDVYIAITDKKIISSDYSVLLGNAFADCIKNMKGDIKNAENSVNA